MNEELLDELAARAETYGVLARCFASELDGPAVAWFAGLEGEALGDDNLAAMAAFAREGAPGQAVATALAVDYARLFVVRAKDTVRAAYPTESVYASPDRTTVSGARDAVKALYRAAGLALDDAGLAEDHIAIELSYMRLLAEKTLACAQEGDREGCSEAAAASRSFLDEHLCRWVPYFVGTVREVARTPFYQGLAGFFEDFLAEDRAFLDKLAQELAGRS